MTIEPGICDRLLAALPSLRAFALSLTNDASNADDLVQDTIVRAWGSLHRFAPGTNLEAWLFTILRNSFYSRHRKTKRELEDVDGFHAGRQGVGPDQMAHLAFEDFRKALLRLSPDQREAILLIGAQGFSYEDAASICMCAVGTIKSRVSRARERLAELLSVEQAEDIGPDHVTLAALQAAA